MGTLRLREAVVLAGTALAPVLAVGALATGTDAPLTAAAASLVAILLLARRLDGYRSILQMAGEGERRRQVRLWTTLKVLGITMHILVLLAGIVLVVGTLLRTDVILYQTAAVSQATVDLAVRGFAVLLVAGLAAVHHVSLLVPLRKRGDPLRTFSGYAAAAAALVTALAVHVVETGPVGLGPLIVGPWDSAFLHLAAVGFAGIATTVFRSPPTLGLVLVGEEAYYRGHTSFTREQSMGAPAALAVALLLAVLFGGVVLLVGLGDLLGVASRNAAVGGVLALMLVGIMGTAVAAVLLWRSGQEVPLYRESPTRSAQIQAVILWGCGVLGLVPLGIGIALLVQGEPVLGFEPRQALPAIGIAILVWTGLPGYWSHRKHQRIRALERKFPDFLRDIASSRQAGLTLEKAIRVASRSEYGALDPEVDKMAEQLSWNVSFQEALHRFSNRVDTPLVHRAVLLIDEADHAGGDVTSILMAAARDAREIKGLERDRRTNMSLYTVVIYVAFLVFLGVTAAMFATFIPQIVQASEGLGGGGGLTGLSFGGTSVLAYRNFYLTVALVQAVGSGGVAGYVESGEITAGMKHVFVMVLITLVAFLLLV